MIRAIYKCLDPDCGKELISKNGREVKFCQMCYVKMRKAHGTRYCANLKPVLLEYREMNPKKQNPVAPTLTAQVFDDHHICLTTTDENIKPKQNESMDVLEWDTLSTNDLKYLFVELSEKNTALKLELARYKELLNSIICQVIDMEYPREKPEPEPDVVLEEEMPPDKPVYDHKRICSANGCKNPVAPSRAFCSEKCAKSVLTNSNSRMLFEGRIISGVKNGTA